MPAQVFLSYASADQPTAEKLRAALERRNVRCFFAPAAIRLGEQWAERLAVEIPQCSVFVLLWSHETAKSPYVKQEIHIAFTAGLYIAPVDVEGNAAGWPIQLATAQWVALKTLGIEGIATVVSEHLHVSDAPYPLNRLYQEILGGLDFRRHLEATRLLIRFVTLIQVAGYVRLRERSEPLNRKIEGFLSARSLFVDLEIAREASAWLGDHGGLVNDSIRDFLKIPIHRVPSAREVDESDDAADLFDEKHLHQLCGARNDLGEGSRLPPDQARIILCYGMRDYIRQALAAEWSAGCRIFISVDGAGVQGRLLDEPIDLSPEQAGRAQIFLHIGSRTLDLTPFFILIPSGTQVPGRFSWDVGILRWQDEQSHFTSVTTTPQTVAVGPPVFMPWGRVEILRSLPQKVYAGEVHTVTLQVINHSFDAVRIPKIEEALPQNLTSIEGAPMVLAASDVELRAGEKIEVQYAVRGKDEPGVDRTYPGSAVPFLFRGETASSTVAGDADVVLRAIPQPELIVARQILNRNGEPAGERVALDSVLLVHTEIQSGGGALPDVVVEDAVEGAVLIAGNSTLYSGALQRLDLQPPLQARYTLRVTGKSQVAIRARAVSGSSIVSVEGADIRLGVDDRPPPRIELRWAQVVRRESNALDADLRIENTGGTSAHALRIAVDAPGEIMVSLPPAPEVPLEAGERIRVPVTVEWQGVPSRSVRFTVFHASVTGQQFENTLPLDPSRIIDLDVATLPVIGRTVAREQVRSALVDADTVLFSVYGPEGLGKRRIVMAEIDRLGQAEGRPMSVFELDCRLVDSFAEAVAMLIEKMVFAEAPENEKGSLKAMTEFLNRSGMNEEEYKGYVKHLESLIHRSEKPHHGTWHAIEMLLTRMVRARGLNRLILLFRSVSEFAKAEIEGLAVLRQYLRPPQDVRIIVTCHDALKMPAMDREIEVRLPSEEECRALIDRVFVMPRPGDALVAHLLEKSDRLPSNLVSLLNRIVENADTLLDFTNPVAGVRIRNKEAFDALPTSLLESESKAVTLAEIQPVILASLAAIRIPLTTDGLQRVIEKTGERISPAAIEAALKECRRRHWLQPSGDKLEIVSSTVRAAFRRNVPPQTMERVHMAIFSLMEEEKRPPEICFPHLVEAPAEFISRRGTQLIEGLRSLVVNGSFTQVRAILSRLQTAQLRLDASGDLELRLIEQELRWEETADLNPDTLKMLLGSLRETGDRKQRTTLKTRLCLLESKWESKHNHNYAKAAEVAESAESWPFGRLNIDDPRLQFDFYLTLWDIYYHLLDEKKFAHVDQWIWKWLSTKRDGHYDSYAITKFLGLFLEFQRQFESVEARNAHFPVPMTHVMGEYRAVRDNVIEKATRTSRILESFLDQFLSNPDALNQTNVLMLGRLYLDMGVALWGQSRTRRRLAGGVAEPEGDDDANAESYMVRAENLFAEAGFLFDLANARVLIGDSYIDRLSLAEKTGDRANLIGFCTLAAKWLQLGAEDFERVGAREQVCDAWEDYADVTRRWAAHQPDQLGNAIVAFERLIGLPEIAARTEKRDSYRLSLAGLYEKAKRFGDATRILGEMEVQTAQVTRLRALIRARALLNGTETITARNAGDFVQDLENLVAAKTSLRSDDKPAPGTASSDVSEAVGVIAWHLAGYYHAQKEGRKALKTLRDSRVDIAGAGRLAPGLREQLPSILPDLWQMEGSPDDQMTQDFSNLLLPVMNAESRGPVLGMLDAVWKLDLTRPDVPHFAGADMMLVLCEWSLDRGTGIDEDKDLAAGVVARLRERGAWQGQAIARIMGRAFALLFRYGAASSDDGAIAELTDVVSLLKEQKFAGCALQIVVGTLELLLEAYRTTQNVWYFDIIRRLSPELKPLQELSGNDFEEAAHLISLYLQLPEGLNDAVGLMERQCEYLVSQQNYKLLPNYLSFLSDLLGNARRRDQELEELMHLADEALATEGESPSRLAESGKTIAVRSVATQLCGRIIRELRNVEIDRDTERHVLYNAAKLLPRGAMADLSAAIYLKLYDLADNMGGSYVWAVYNAWNERAASGDISLDDAVAVTAYANSENEGDDGKFGGTPRNYLITAQARNNLIGRLVAARPWDPELFVAYAELEIHRLGFLTVFIDRIHGFLQELDDFERMAWVTFLHGYLISGNEGGPFWQKLRRIESHQDTLKNDINRLVNELSRRGVMLLHASFQDGMRDLSYRVQQFLVANRKRGREILSQLASRIRVFPLEDILGEVQGQLEGRARSIDFSAVLGLWSQPNAEGGDRAEIPEAFLDRDPATLIHPLAENAARLFDAGEPALAERLYRYALSLFGVGVTENQADAAALRAGLSRCLAAQGKGSQEPAMEAAGAGV